MRGISDQPLAEGMEAPEGAVRLLEAVLDNAPVGLAFFGRDHRHVRVNEAFASMTGTPVEAHVGRTAEEVLGHELDELAADIDWVFASGEPVVNREVAVGNGGQWLLSHYPVTVDDDVMWVGTIATDITPLRRAERERVDLLAAERRARAAAERMASRLARLQAVTARLTAAADADEVARVVCDHGAAGLGAAGGALMLLVDDGRELEMVRQTGYPGDVMEAFQRFPADAPLPACDAVRTRAMVLLTDKDERDRRYPGLVGTPMVHHAHAVVPLVFGGHVLGAMSFGFNDARTFDDDDRRFLLAVASQASQAIERARLHEVERDAARRQRILAETSGLLATSADLAETMFAIARLLVVDFVDACSIDLTDGAATRVGATDDEVGYTISIPLRTVANELGVLVLSRREVDFRAPDFALATEIADRMAIAFDNALVHRSRAEQAKTLQASLLPPRLPEIEGLVIDTRYQPVGDGSLVGGDFYDVFALGDGRWGLMIGDVCGQGVVAASLTSLVRYTARAAARQWSSPADVLRFTNSTLGEHDLGERFCTILFAAIEPDESGAALTIAVGGHHPALLHRPGEGITTVGEPGSALGLLPDALITDTSVRLAPGDTLVLFTDGVIEARTPEGEHVGEDFLTTIVAANAAAGPAAIGAAVERAVLDIGGGRSHDDMAVLTVGIGQRAAVTSARERTFDHRYPAEVMSVRMARSAVREWLDAHELAQDRMDDLLVALTELATNAVRAARTTIQVRAWATSDSVWVEVIADGAGFDPSIPHSARDLDPLAERGRGLFLVASLADECTIESGPNGTIVRCAVAR
jgi:PAS domain S-box-containing protein